MASRGNLTRESGQVLGGEMVRVGREGVVVVLAPLLAKERLQLAEHHVLQDQVVRLCSVKRFVSSLFDASSTNVILITNK